MSGGDQGFVSPSNLAYIGDRLRSSKLDRFWSLSYIRKTHDGFEPLTRQSLDGSNVETWRRAIVTSETGELRPVCFRFIVELFIWNGPKRNDLATHTNSS